MKLLIEDDEGNRSVVPVIRDEITIGRKEGNTIRLTERNVSRQHARLVRQNGALYVEDVKARYGIKKNGQKIDDRTQFQEGDVVSIGDYRLTLRPEQAAEARAQAGGDAAAEISSDLQNQATQVTKIEDVEGAPDQQASSASQGAEARRSETEVLKADPAKLVVVSSNFAGQEFPLDRDEMVIGRGDDCNIIIDHRSVSNTHAKVVREGPAVYKIVDLNSRNGVKIDGEEYKSVHLERGDVVTLGHVKFRFVEPGENYVFSPQSAGGGGASAGAGSDEFGQPSPEPGMPAGDMGGSSSGLSPMVLGGGAVALLAVVAVGFFALTGGGNGGADNGSGGEAAQTAENTAGSAAGDEKGGGAEANPKVAKQIASAEKSIDEGNLQKAIGSLESIRNLLEPTPEQNDKIDKLLSKARTEQPSKRAYTSAKSKVKEEAWEPALAKLEEIPDHSLFRDIARKEGVLQKALDGVLGEAEGQLKDEEYEAARELATRVSDWEPRKGEAEELIERIDRAEKKAEQAKVAAKTRSPSGSGGSTGDSAASGSSGSQAAGAGSQGGGQAKPDPRPDPEPKQETVSAAEAKKLFRGATKKWIRGNHSGAISDCRKALKGGYTPCYRVMGMASKQMGKKGDACRYFKRYLNTGPSDASKIRNQMDQLGCN